MLDVAVTASDDWPDTIDWDNVLATAVDAANNQSSTSITVTYVH